MPQPRTTVRGIVSTSPEGVTRNYDSMAEAYRHSLTTNHPLGASEHQRIRAALRDGRSLLDRHGFTWTSRLSRRLEVLNSERLANDLAGNPAPTSNLLWLDFTFGVELEFYVPCDRADLQQRLFAFKMRENIGEWVVVRDGSLDGGPTGFSGVEIVSPVLMGEEGLSKVKKVSEWLKNEQEAKVHPKCGLHVHIGVKSLPPAYVRKIAQRFINNENNFDLIMPPSRKREGLYYCKSNVGRMTIADHERLTNARTIQAVAFAINGGFQDRHYTDYRYYKLNLQSFLRHGTIEFRQHQGSVDFERITHWVRLVTGFCAYATTRWDGAANESFDNFLESSTDSIGVEFYRKRKEKFGG